MNYLEVLEPLVPALVITVVITALVYVGGARRAKRYRPGRPFDFTPVWFLAKPEQVTGTAGPAVLPSGPARAAVTSTEHVPGPLLAQPVPDGHGVTGGASDRW